MERLGKLREFFKKNPDTKEVQEPISEEFSCEVCRNTSYYILESYRVCTYCNEVYRKLKE